MVWLGFNGISTIVGYLMLNPVYTYKLNVINKMHLQIIYIYGADKEKVYHGNGNLLIYSEVCV